MEFARKADLIGSASLSLLATITPPSLSHLPATQVDAFRTPASCQSMHDHLSRGTGMNNITIRQRILLSFTVIIAVMLLMGGIALQKLFHIQAEEEQLRKDSLPGMYVASQMSMAWYANYEALHALAVADSAGRAKTKEELRVRRKEFEKFLSSYEGTIFRAEDRENFEAVKHQSESYFALQSEVIRLYESDPLALLQELRIRVCVTVSIGGVTSTPSRGDEYAHALAAADEALYEAKRAGKNRAVHRLSASG